ncbi:hypothetical protein Ppa06_09040 [Planomonospora parontospora subsp. parontospora]|uniref:Uncharacterized protein n=2 Tax=Planomonospora parontospora TaxID=58119 RepID=A0AA37F2P6_9ACTN|nr:hypothetical protein [Planomonospora parontospora]GGK50561.1 hypothetical protein GCM10010126_07570 [Planomonospora parontospora]GII07106.1 hypothetical protein Ppa06_09040 [Planomonospora parontospora subsp. parontospora]
MAPQTPGYEVAAGHLEKFAGTAGDAGTEVQGALDGTPRFEGWNLAPLAGVPLVGLLFVNRLNAVADTWAAGARVLRETLASDSERLVRVAATYVQVERANAAGGKP